MLALPPFCKDKESDPHAHNFVTAMMSAQAYWQNASDFLKIITPTNFLYLNLHLYQTQIWFVKAVLLLEY
jgi:hypothetical protein